MRYSLTFFILTVVLVVIAIAAWESIRWAAILTIYVAFSFALLAIAYAGVGAKMMFKRPSGRQSIIAWILFAPYFLLNALTFRAYRWFTKEPAYVQIAPNLYFGRRLSAREHAADWTSVLDLAGEFPSAWPQRGSSCYRSLPILDATAPTEDELRSAASWVADAAETGPVYVHCALGHGRSACVVIAYLLSVGAISTVAEGVQELRALRPGVRLHPPQTRLLRRFGRGGEQ